MTINSKHRIKSLKINNLSIPQSSLNTSFTAQYGFKWNVAMFGGNKTKFTIEISALETTPIKITLVDYIYSLPEIPGQLFLSRPNNSKPHSFSITDSTLIKKSFYLQGNNNHE